MGINITGKTRKPQALKLFNAIASYLFEQEYDELKNEKAVTEALKNAKSALATLIKK